VHEAANRRAKQFGRKPKCDKLVLKIPLPDALRVFDKPVSQHGNSPH